MVKIRVLLLLGICVTAPFLYAQCVAQMSCYYSYSDGSGYCGGSATTASNSEANAYYLQGAGTCGTMHDINGTDFIIARDGRIAAVYLFFDKL